MSLPPRYALYYAPDAASPLWTFGSGVIGYDAYSGRDVPFAPPVLAEVNGEINADWHPRKYGFHATLKAPMLLAPETDEAGLIAAADSFAARTQPVRLEGLAVTLLETNFALRPLGDVTALDDFAFAVVKDFDAFRAPLTEDERERRLKSPLTERQRDHLERYGYHYVGEEFWFHMTLTGPIAPARREEIGAVLESRYTALGCTGPVIIDNVTLFRQEDRAKPFRIIARFPLIGT
jgi:putative phosphonate metabolism protein